MSGTPLFLRYFRVVVDTIEIKSLDVRFKIEKNLKAQPNKAEISIFNLNEAHRSQLEQLPTVAVSVEAGYVGGSSMIFLGDLRRASSQDSGPDIITTISSGDGEKAIQTARVNVSIRKGTPSDVVIKTVAKALGVGEGNLNKAVSTIKGAGLGTLFQDGTVISGSAAREMTSLCKSVGFTWSVQGGKLQLLPLQKTLEGEALSIKPDTGLIGSPSVDNKGVMKCRTLLIPDVFPGRKLVLESARLKGQYRIEATTHTGDTSGQDWYIDIEGKRY
jgi:hypothetical protein